MDHCPRLGLTQPASLPGRLLPGGRYPWWLHSRSARLPAPLLRLMGSPCTREADAPDTTYGILTSGQTPPVVDVPASMDWLGQVHQAGATVPHRHPFIRLQGGPSRQDILGPVD